MTVFYLRAIEGYEGGLAVFIFKILVGLSVQLRALAFLASGKYSPVGLAVERPINVCPPAVWIFSRRNKFVAPARNRTTILRTLFGG